MVVVTVDPVVHLFVAVFTLAGAVRRRRSYAGHSSGQGWRPGLTCGTGDVHVIKTGLLLKRQAWHMQGCIMCIFTVTESPFGKPYAIQKQLIYWKRGKAKNIMDVCLGDLGKMETSASNTTKQTHCLCPKDAARLNYWHIINPPKST